MAFNIFATATSDIPLANLDANFTMIGSSAVASTLYPTATTSITYGTAGTSHIFSGSIGAFTLGGTVAGGGNQLNNVIIGTSSPLAGAFTTLSATGDFTLSGTVGRVVSNVNSKRVLIAGGSSAATTTGAYAIFEGYDYGGAGAGGAISLVSAAGTTNPITMSVGGTTRGVFSSTGLAVTGTLNVGGSSRTTDKFTVKNTTTNEWAASVVSSGANASESLGLLIIAGTDNTDYALRINSQAASPLMYVSGSGNLLVGATSQPVGTSRAVFSTTGNTQAAIFINDTFNYSSTINWNKATANNNYFVEFATEGTYTARGTITYNRAGGLTVYSTTSDYRLKENIVDLPDALETVSRLKPRQFDWKETGNTTTGFIAHELAEVCPHAVTGEKDATEMRQYEISPAIPATQDEEGNELTAAIEAVMGEREVPRYQGIDTSFLVATLTAAIQEQQAIITALTTRITALEAK